MACQEIIAQVTADVVGTVLTFSGVGFRPAYVRLRWSGINSQVDALARNNLRCGEGFIMENGKRGCIAQWRQDNTDPYGTGHSIWNDEAVVTMSGPASTNGKADFYGMTDDGFQLIIDEQFLAVTTCIAWCVSGCEFNVLEITEPGAISLQSYTGAGFRPTTIVQLLGAGATAYGTPTSDDQVCIGAAMGPSADQQGIWACFEDSSLGLSQEARYCRRTECLAIITDAAVISRAKLNAFLDDGIQLDWLERSASHKYLVVVATGRWFVGPGNTRTDLNAFTITGMTWTPQGLVLISAGMTEPAQDVVSTTNNGGDSVGYAAESTDQGLIFTRWNNDGNTGNSKEIYMHLLNPTEAVYGSTDDSGTPTLIAAGAVNGAYTPDTVPLIMLDADAVAAFFYIVVVGPEVIEQRQRLVKYFHNTIVSRWEGRPIIRDVQGRDLPPEEIQPDNYLFTAAFMFPTPVKRHSNLEENHLHYIETVGVSGERLRISVERESLFSSVLRRLG